MLMAASANDYHLPSKGERGIIQSEIIALENEVMEVQKVIEQAQLRIDELTQQLNDRKSRIAPIRKASFDILSLIFEHCSEIDWKLPLTIAVVSRRWRETILHTPRAWCFIDTSSLNKAGIHAYFERSGNCGLHVALDYPYTAGLLTPVAHRILCLAFPFQSGRLEDLTFPRLTHLRSSPFYGGVQCNDPSMITHSRFPNLRHLEVRNLLLAVENCEELRSLQTLKITVFDDDDEWSELLNACKKSLIFLQITCSSDYCISEMPQMELPNLCYLKVVDENHGDCSWASSLDTPALRVYWEESDRSEGPLEYPKSITHLHLERVPSMFPTQLRILQLDISLVEFRSVISTLKNDPSLCPHLEILEFGRKYVGNFALAAMKKTLDEYDWESRSGLLHPTIIAAKWSVSLPDEIEAECENDMPCTLW